jgi:hypothetical protein
MPFTEANIENAIIELFHDYLEYDYTKSIEDDASKCNICTLKCTLEELVVWRYLKDNPRAT